MSDHAYAISGLSTPIDTSWIQCLIINESPPLVSSKSEIEVYMALNTSPSDVTCKFVPNLTGAQITQLDAIMAGDTAKPPEAPPDGVFTDTDATLFTTSTTFPEWHTCMDNTVTLDPGVYLVRMEGSVNSSEADEPSRMRFVLDGAQVGNRAYFYPAGDDDDKGWYGCEVDFTIPECGRRDVQITIEFARNNTGTYSAKLRDQRQRIERKLGL